MDGCHPSRAAFGMGLYIDNYSRNVEVRGNTVISTTITGIFTSTPRGQIVDNTVYNASTGTEYSAHISLGGDDTRATVTGNRLYGLSPTAWTLYASSRSNFVASDYNYLFHPYVAKHIAFGLGVDALLLFRLAGLQWPRSALSHQLVHPTYWPDAAFQRVL